MKYDVFVPQPFLNNVFSEMERQRDGKEEVIGFIFLNTERLGKENVRLIPRDYLVPNRENYTLQSSARLQLDTEVSIQIINEYLSEGYSILQIHTHPGNQKPEFSGYDDLDERGYAEFLANYDSSLLMFSAVFNEDFSKSTIRRWDTSNAEPINDASLRTKAFAVTNSEKPASSFASSVLDRQRVFGAEFTEKIAGLKVGLIGCGGVGSCVAEIFSRLGARQWVLCDHDKIELSNLNRLPGSRRSDVGEMKVNYVESLIRSLWGRNAKVRKYPSPISEVGNRKDFRSCDLLICATDNNHSRVAAQEISSANCIPLIDLGVDIEVGEGRGMRNLARITIPPLKGNSWSLISTNRANLMLAEMERSPEHLKDTHYRPQGYMEDVEAPAVYWLNSYVSATAIGMLHEWIIGERCFLDGIDLVCNFGERDFMEIERDDDVCIFTATKGIGLFGLGSRNKIG